MIKRKQVCFHSPVIERHSCDLKRHRDVKQISLKGFIFSSVFDVNGSEVKASPSNVGDPGLVPGSGRSPGEGNGNPLQYSCLENPMEIGAW